MRIGAGLAVCLILAAASRAETPNLVDRVNVGAYRTRADGMLVWPRRYFGISARMDWSPYDFVEFTLYNPSARPIPFAFEVKDAASSDYWTRVNLPQILAPGLQTIRLPTRLRVGETGRPGRALDSAKVVSLILGRTDERDETPVEVRRIELKKSAKADAPGIFALHAGPEDAGAPDGFEALTENTLYNPARKWGWLEHSFWAPYPQVNRVIAPDRLTASNLTIASAKLRMDLKPGNYRVWMIIDHPGGFWGEYPYYHRRIVRAQGRIALDERMTAERAKADYFRWQDAEDREGDDLFDKYWSQILPEKSFDVGVENGRLELDFENEGCPAGLPCFGLALSALAVYPINTAEQRATGARWLARLRESRRAEFRSQHQLKDRPLTRLLASMPSGLRAWNVAPSLDLSRALPADLHPAAGAPRVSAFRNSKAFFAPAVSWKGDRMRTVAWRLEGIPAGVAAEGGWIKYRALRDSYDGNIYAVRERWITDETRRAFAAQGLGRLWLRLAVSSGATPGLYPAAVVLSASGSTETVKIPFGLRVFKARAASLDFPAGPFNDRIQEDWWDPAVLRPRLERLEKTSLRKIRALGATAFSFSPRLRFSAGGNLDAAEADRVMAQARSLGFQGVVGYGDVFLGEDLCRAAGPGSALSGDGLKRAAAALESHAKEKNWLPLALIVCDEPVGEAAAAAAERLRELPPMDSSRRVQWSATTSLGKYASPQTRALVSRLSLPFLSAFSPEDVRSPWAYYNDSSRDSVGLGMFRLRETTDLRARLLWNWNANSANPYFDFDGREGDAAWCSSRSDESLRCTVELDRAIESGFADYGAALGLKRFLAQRRDLTPEQRAEGERILHEARAEGTDADAWTLRAGEYEEKLVESSPASLP